MPSPLSIIYYLCHPSQLRAIIQWKVWHNPVHERDLKDESPELTKCFYYLDKTSRSFASVIKELHPELLVPVCLFYLVLRGLDTIEDDMTIPLKTKEPILREFDKIMKKPGWNFDGNHSKEKDRDLLVEFQYVISEFAKIKEPYQAIILDIANRMGNGMADYCVNADKGVDTISEYETYCHHVAGLVGEGCTRLFVEAKLANPVLLDRPELMESMGQFLQQVNVIRDVREDWDEQRRFWPKEIWSKYVDDFGDLMKPENKEIALNCSSDMIANALKRADECLFYLAGLREQSVFNFCAIPQTMAIATLDLCYRNPQMFLRNIKITKGQACQNMLDSTGNLQMVCDSFRSYTRSIHAKSIPQDPSFISISASCGKIEQFIENIFPSQEPPKLDSRTKQERELAKQREKEDQKELIYVGLAVFAAIFLSTATMFLVAWYFGARFDLIWAELKLGTLFTPGPAESSCSTPDRVEL